MLFTAEFAVTLSMPIEIEADSREEAIEKAKTFLWSGDIQKEFRDTYPSVNEEINIDLCDVY